MLAAAPAFAHHVAGYEIPQTMLAGILSGLGHPVIGIGHLAFLIALGVLCYRYALGPRAIPAFLLGTLLGAAIHVAGWSIPADEALLAVTAIAIGWLLIGRHEKIGGSALFLAAIAVAGVVHGSVYAESIEGASAAVLLAYFVGVTAMQAALALGAYALGRTLLAGAQGNQRRADTAIGIAAVAMGGLLLLGPVLA